SSGNASTGDWIDPTHIVRNEHGGVTGLVQDARIVWSDGTIWDKQLQINGTTATGGVVSIAVDADQILLASRPGGGSRARLVSPQTIYAIDWGITGTLVNDQIHWSNGTIWKDFGSNNLNAAFSDISTLPFPNIVLQGRNERGSANSIELRQNAIFLTSKNGAVTPATITGPNMILAVNWNLTGTLEQGQIVWSDGTSWKGFDPTLLNYVFGNV
ncbi:MAG: hypothetical protein JWN70_7031, partial [Planctomycetaceae bacterium]|nr:hypothetical protein [Planctomycetaceae bacterium]